VDGLSRQTQTKQNHISETHRNIAYREHRRSTRKESRSTVHPIEVLVAVED
jgi:hypothetical protein